MTADEFERRALIGPGTIDFITSANVDGSQQSVEVQLMNTPDAFGIQLVFPAFVDGADYVRRAQSLLSWLSFRFRAQDPIWSLGARPPPPAGFSSSSSTGDGDDWWKSSSTANTHRSFSVTVHALLSILLALAVCKM